LGAVTGPGATRWAPRIPRYPRRRRPARPAPPAQPFWERRLAGGWIFATLTGADNEWLVGTTVNGELVSYDLNPLRRFSLRPSTWTFKNLVSPGGGVYYAQKADGALWHYVDRDPSDGKGTDIGPGRRIDTGGWTQRLLTAQPRVCS
jgi:hypothetical protein